MDLISPLLIQNSARIFATIFLDQYTHTHIGHGHRPILSIIYQNIDFGNGTYLLLDK